MAIAASSAWASAAAPGTGRTAASAEASSRLPWIADDWPRAVALAKERKVPIFVENWAPWCHTCRSMKAFVFTDKSLARHAGQFVWLEIDRENAKNSEFRKRFPVPGIPTFAIVDPVTRTEKRRWVGAMTVSQLHVLLDDARGHADTPRDLIVRLAFADSLYGVPNYVAAIPAYNAVVAAAPARWSGYSRVVEALQLCLTSTDQNESSIALARAALPRLGVSGPAMNVAAAALESAVALPETTRVRMPALAEMEAATHRLVTDFTFTVAADDRSGAWIALLDARHDANDSLGVHRVAECWSTFLDGEAATALTPEERTVFDSHRLSAYMELEQPERAIPMLEQSQKNFPDDYNPPYRLAIAYRAMHRWDAALVAAARADSMMYGPRKLNLYDVRTDVYLGSGDPAAAKRSIEDAIHYAESLPEEQRSAARIAGYRKRLAAMR